MLGERRPQLPRYGHHILDFLYDSLKLIWGDPRARIPRFLIASGVAAVVSPWWLPIAGEIFASYLGLDRDRITRFDTTVFYSGWAFIAIGIYLWVRFRGDASGTKMSEVLRSWESGTQRLSSRLSRQLSKLRYEASRDVRLPIDVKPGVHVVAGESGQGKTWQLARTATDFLRQGGAVAWVGAHIKPAEIEREIARVVWNEGFEGESTVDLTTLSRHCDATRPKQTFGQSLGLKQLLAPSFRRLAIFSITIPSRHFSLAARQWQPGAILAPGSARGSVAIPDGVVLCDATPRRSRGLIWGSRIAASWRRLFPIKTIGRRSRRGEASPPDLDNVVGGRWADHAGK
jgi:hypothetical protein